MIQITESQPRALSLEAVRQRWSGEIERRILESCDAAGLVGEMLVYHVSSGGKRLRAIVPPWVCANLGGAAADALDIGAGIELIHNASLIHDDVQDGDAVRRGRETVWRRWGVAQAINAGDALLFAALARIARAPSGARVLPVVCNSMVRVVEGQAMDLQLRLPDGDPARLRPTTAAWMEVARKKTGALFGACFQAGAIAARVDAATAADAAEYGVSLGVLFQVQDDLRDILGDEGTGARGADLVSGAISFPVVWAYDNAAPSDVAALQRLVERCRIEMTPSAVESTIALLERTGALAATAQWLARARDAALRHPMAAVAPGLAARLIAPIRSSAARRPDVLTSDRKSTLCPATRT